VGRSGRNLTMDCWKTRERYERFLKANRAEYGRIDRQCEKLTLAEEYLGAFSDVESLE